MGVFQGEVLLGYTEIHLPQGHARTLAPSILHLLKMLKVTPSALQAVAVSSGPGSYTGLRVGTSTAKGLCLALDIPLLSLPTLEVLAWQAADLARKLNARICPMLDARRMEVFTSLYDKQIQQLQPVKALVLEENVFEDILADGPIIFVGDGVEKATQLLAEHPNAWLLSPSYPSAKFMGTPLLKKYLARDFESLDDFAPFYLKEVRITTPKSKVPPAGN